MNTRSPKHDVLCLAIVAASLLATSPASAETESADATPPTLAVAVLGFDTDATDLKATATDLRELVTAELTNQPGLALVERQRIDLALAELELGLSGIVKGDGAARIGRLVGARVLVTGRVFRMGEGLHITSRIISVETGRVFVQSAALAPGEPTHTLAGKLARKIASVSAGERKALLAGAEPPDERLTRLARMTNGRTLPTLSIEIEERHAGRATIDPAAATELGGILRQLGFRLVEAGSGAGGAQVRITGEAMSERGLRRGNLVSVAGRVELKAVDVRSSEVIAVLRHTERVVDLSEQIAGKEALARASAVLSEQLVSSLVNGS